MCGQKVNMVAASQPASLTKKRYILNNIFFKLNKNVVQAINQETPTFNFIIPNRKYYGSIIKIIRCIFYYYVPNNNNNNDNKVSVQQQPPAALFLGYL